MKRKITYIFILILLLPIIGTSQVSTDSDSSIIGQKSDFKTQGNQSTTQEFVTQQILLEKKWGNHLTTLLQQVEKVNVFHLESFKAENLDINHIEGFPILKKGTLDKPTAKQFLNLVTDTSTYSFTSMMKQCLFLPQMGIELTTANNDTIHVLISLKCDLIRFYYDKKIKVFNCDDGHKTIAQYFSSVFPDVRLSRPASFRGKSPKPIYYVVKSGDGWYKIQRFAQKKVNKAITIHDLYKWNKVTKDKQNQLKIGQKVVIGYQS